MSCVSEPEVQFAQKLASNEKPLRKKTLKKLRSYISARSRTPTGFSEEELLKLWKGLFYCLWMQDKPLLQEELSSQISGLLHHFHSFSAQLLYLQTFLTTMKREWTGIDRLRMDKYYQLVRLMFRQTFEVLRRRRWESSCVRLFLELLSTELLQSGAPPAGLQLHVLDLYLRELAEVGAHELSADQNLVFVEPFCKAAAKTKDRAFFRAVCSGIFSTIIDQAPFAIQELMDELQDSDSGQASDDGDEAEEPETTKRTKKRKTKGPAHVNGLKTLSEEDHDEDDDDDGLPDSEKTFDEDVGPVLQFDYSSLADKLLEQSSRQNTPSRNRQRLYKIVRVLRDLSQGIFPQDEYPEEVSTDEDDDDFGSRKRMKRRMTEDDKEEEEEEEVKKDEGKKKKTLPLSSEQNCDASSEEVKKKRKKKKKKKKPQSQTEAENSESTPPPQTEASLENPEPEPAVGKKKRKNPKPAPEPPASENLPPTREVSERPAQTQDSAPQTGKKKKKKKPKGKCEHVEHQETSTAAPEQDKEAEEAPEETSHEGAGTTAKKSGQKIEEDTEKPVRTAKKRKAAAAKKRPPPTEEEEMTKRRRKIPVEFEYEAHEVQDQQDAPDSKTPATPKSDSKKVRFGLKQNQTAEFRKSDRSLLLSPEGTSRVPFDPEQKPKCGVLKSPPTPLKQKKKKTATPTQKKKKAGGVAVRPKAADFF